MHTKNIIYCTYLLVFLSSAAMAQSDNNSIINTMSSGIRTVPVKRMGGASDMGDTRSIVPNYDANTSRFRNLDTNKDGFISQSKFISNAAYNGNMFAHCDINDDGLLNQSEATRYWSIKN
jgi:hypothetical protein